MYYFYDYSKIPNPKRPELLRLGCWVFAASMFLAGILIFLALFFPRPWLAIAFCMVPLLTFGGPLAATILQHKGQNG